MYQGYGTKNDGRTSEIIEICIPLLSFHHIVLQEKMEKLS